MGDEPSGPDNGRQTPVSVVQRSHGSGMTFALVAVALILAIAFFYLTNDQGEDRRADRVTAAAGSVDDAARVVSDAARNAADALRNAD